MKKHTLLVISLVLLSIITIINLSVLAGTSTIRIKGKGNGFIKKEKGITTVGCDRENENECSVTTTVSID